MVKLYNNEDNVCGICYNGTSYYFVKNLQGDVISLVVKTGMDEESRYVVAANYTYDAWGKCTVKDADGDVKTASDFVGNINPYRYRGYYYDVETGLYYLRSRYYDAEIGRWLNSDNSELLGVTVITNHIITMNLFTYCENCPINDHDLLGSISAKQLAAMIALSSDGDEFNKNKDGSYTHKKQSGNLKNPRTGIMEENIGVPVLKRLLQYKPGR